MKWVVGLCLGGVLAVPVLASEDPAQDNPVIDLGPLAAGGTNVVISSPANLPLYVHRKAGRVLDRFAAGTALTVLAMDRYGLRVRGRGTNGAITGWVGKKSAFAADQAGLDRLRAFYDRQLEIAALVASKTPAIGTNLAELEQILGKPTQHLVDAGPDGRTDTAVWVINEKVDLNELLDAGTDEEILKVSVEVGRIEVELVGGVARVIRMNTQRKGDEIPVVAPPVTDPFGPSPKAALAGK